LSQPLLFLRDFSCNNSSNQCQGECQRRRACNQQIATTTQRMTDATADQVLSGCSHHRTTLRCTLAIDRFPNLFIYAKPKLNTYFSLSHVKDSMFSFFCAKGVEDWFRCGKLNDFVTFLRVLRCYGIFSMSHCKHYSKTGHTIEIKK